MKLKELLAKGEKLLFENQIDNSKSEALWLMEDTLNLTYSHIVFEGEKILTTEEENSFLKKIDKRISGVPVQYILGKWEFYGREYKVGEGVLIPRPETELIPSLALEYLKGKPNPVVIDLCAGTGCIGFTIAYERPDARVYSVEKYPEAFAYLEQNGKDLKNAKLIKGDVLTSLENLNLPKADLVVSNPPYIESGEIAFLQSEVLKEPITALDGGEDGLMFYRAIAKALPRICKGALILECGENQAEKVARLFGRCKIIKDFAGIDRVVVFEGETDDI